MVQVRRKLNEIRVLSEGRARAKFQQSFLSLQRCFRVPGFVLRNPAKNYKNSQVQVFAELENETCLFGRNLRTKPPENNLRTEPPQYPPKPWY